MTERSQYACPGRGPNDWSRGWIKDRFVQIGKVVDRTQHRAERTEQLVRDVSRTR